MSAPLSRIHSIWLVVLFLCGLAYIAVIPPFKSIDEIAHWDRMWTVATGQLACRWIPLAASEWVYLVNDAKVSSTVVLGRGLRHVGGESHLAIATAACQYAPTAYLLPALVTRFVGFGPNGRVIEGGMFWSFYGARIVNWLAFFAVLWLVVWRVTWARNLLLVFASVPEVVQQATALNQDSLIFGCTLLLVMAWQARASWYSVASTILLAAAVTNVKPVFGGYALLVLLILPRMREGVRSWHRWVVPLASVAIALGSWRLWYYTLRTSLPGGHETHIPVLGVAADEQVAFLKSEPWQLVHLMYVQLGQLFDHSPIRGSMSSFLGAFGWCQYEVYPFVYTFVLGGIAMALVADGLAVARPEPVPRSPTWAWVLVVAAIVAQFPAMVLLMYEAFTPVKAVYVLGVQGRYFLSALLLLGAFCLYGVKLRNRFSWEQGSWALTIAAGAACLVGNVGALVWVFFFYWQ